MTPTSHKHNRRPRLPLTLLALFLPGCLFVLGLFSLRDHPRFTWLYDIMQYPWEFWVLTVGGLTATAGGVLDWRYHRSGQTHVGEAEHRHELYALAAGGLPLFFLMAAGSVLRQPAVLLLPILVVVLFTVVLICYD